ncbi:MAG: hypothetical protein RSG53_06520 [Oscillospiraceae bacterium]
MTCNEFSKLTAKEQLNEQAKSPNPSGLFVVFKAIFFVTSSSQLP